MFEFNSKVLCSNQYKTKCKAIFFLSQLVCTAETIEMTILTICRWELLSFSVMIFNDKV